MKDPAIRNNRMHCTFALVSAIIVSVCVCIGVTMNLVTLYDENFNHMGIRTFCMFTVNSNILMGLTMLLSIPYTVDGLRKSNYHLPNWIVVVMFTGVTASTLTFLISLFVLAPVKGFVLIFTGSRFFLHGLCPVLAIVSFCFFITSHRITRKETLYALIPVFIYAAVYLIMVVVIGEERGGWNDFYGFATRIPVIIPILLIMPLTYGIAVLLRVLHNHTCLLHRKKNAELYRAVYGSVDARETAAQMARSHKRAVVTADIVIPARLIRHILENSENPADFGECCKRYLDAFLE